MKKYLILFLLSFSVFFCYDKVSALQVNAYYDSDFVNNIIDKNSISDIDNILIPFIEENMKDYIVYIGLKTSNNYSSMFLRIMQKSPNHIPATLSYLRKDYSSAFYVSQPTSINNENNFGSSFYNAKYVEYLFNDYSVSTIVSDLQNWLANPTFNHNDYVMEMFPIDNVIKNDSVDFLKSQVYTRDNLPYYINFNSPLITSNSYSSYNTDYVVHYNGETFTYSLGDSFPTYYKFIHNKDVVLNLVKDFGNNTFGFYQNLVGIKLTSLSGAVDTLSIICEDNRPFVNGYCSMNYDDLKNHNSDINVFNNYASEFTQFFGKNSGYLYNDKYYLYSFRIQKPFVPDVGNIFINSLTDNFNKVHILNVYVNDGGSYTDYVVKFKIQNSNYDSSTNLNDILVVFQNGLGTYYNNTIPNSFNYSVYRSFKLQYFDTEPTMSDVNDFYNNNDLSTIDGVSSQTSFFTDNQFNSFGFGGIVTAPFRFLYALENYDSCSDITVPFPHSNQNLTLTCVRKNIPSSLNPLIVILQVILSGIITYRIAVGTLRIIKDVSSPDNANIEVVDL